MEVGDYLKSAIVFNGSIYRSNGFYRSRYPKVVLLGSKARIGIDEAELSESDGEFCPECLWKFEAPPKLRTLYTNLTYVAE